MELIFDLKCCFAWSFGGFGHLLRLFWEGLGGVWEGLGWLGQAMEPLNCVWDASWGRLGGFGRRLEANSSRLGGFLGRLEGVSGALGTSRASFSEGPRPFLEGFLVFV